jgi:tetratricopeptide (TPR) repeat protein
MPCPRVLAFSAAGFLLLGLPGAFAQSGGSTGGSSTASKPAPTTSTRPSNPPTLQQERRLVFLRGNVVLEDGTEPSERASIERVCNGRVRRESYTDSHGQFGFQFGSEVQGFQDATVSGSRDSLRGMDLGGGSSASGGAPLGTAIQGVTQQELMGCELRANLAGFISDTISLAGRQLSDSNPVGTIVLHRVGKIEGTRVSATSLRAPKDAKKAFERGRNFLKKGKKQEAADEFIKAISLYPKYAEALSGLADIYADERRSDEAKKLYLEAIDADSQFLMPYFGLSILASRESDWKAVAEFSGRALQLNAYEYPAVYFNNAAANYNLHDLDRAEKSARMARRLDSQHHMPRIDLLLGTILIQRGDYAGATEQLQSFLKYQPDGAEADKARQMLDQTRQRTASTPATAPPQ